MRKILFVFIFGTFLHATSILTYNIYENDKQVSIRLSFDSPYSGQIFQRAKEGSTSLTFLNLNFDSELKKAVNSHIIQEIDISPIGNGTTISLKSDKPIAVKASKNADSFALKITAELLAPNINMLTKPVAQSVAKNETSLIDMPYVGILIFLVILLLILYVLKNKVSSSNIMKKTSNSWLFGKNKPEEVQIVFSKNIDRNNSIMLLQYNNAQYLVLTGMSNVLLDKFHANHSEVKNQDEFEVLFEQNRKNIDNYLRLQQANKLDEYKSKASKTYV